MFFSNQLQQQKYDDAELPDILDIPQLQIPLPRNILFPPKRIALPDCAACKKTPREPHAVYCCGSFYCHSCLISKIRNVDQGEVPKCDNCGKEMGNRN